MGYLPQKGGKGVRASYEVILKMEKKKQAVKKACPNCGKQVDFDRNPFRPFCSKRCKMEDLGSWLKEEYYISSSFLDAPAEDSQK